MDNQTKKKFFIFQKNEIENSNIQLLIILGSIIVGFGLQILFDYFNLLDNMPIAVLIITSVTFTFYLKNKQEISQIKYNLDSLNSESNSNS